MKNLITENVKIIYDQELKSLHVSFHGFVLYEELVKAIDYEIEMIKHYNIKTCIINLQEIGVYPIGGEEYVKKIWFPKAIENGLKVIAFIVPTDTLGQLAMQEAHEEAEMNLLIKMKYFDNPPQAVAWTNSLL
jgi:hypothetical protein